MLGLCKDWPADRPFTVTRSTWWMSEIRMRPVLSPSIRLVVVLQHQVLLGLASDRSPVRVDWVGFDLKRAYPPR